MKFLMIFCSSFTYLHNFCLFKTTIEKNFDFIFHDWIVSLFLFYLSKWNDNNQNHCISQSLTELIFSLYFIKLFFSLKWFKKNNCFHVLRVYRKTKQKKSAISCMQDWKDETRSHMRLHIVLSLLLFSEMAWSLHCLSSLSTPY